MLGFDKAGHGETGVLVTNDWLCDTSTWDGARPYLDLERFTYVFADLRGYGRSKHLESDGFLQTAADDLLRVADSLGWKQFAMVGHSMSGLIALHLAQQHPDRVRRAVAITPAPATGFGVDDATVQAIQRTAMAGGSGRRALMERQWGNRLSSRWTEFKLARWNETSTPEAVAAYVPMFAQRGLPDPHGPIPVPVLILTGEHDLPILRADATRESWGALCQRLYVASLPHCGHYPMQEAPPLFAAKLEAFLGQEAVA